MIDKDVINMSMCKIGLSAIWALNAQYVTQHNPLSWCNLLMFFFVSQLAFLLCENVYIVSFKLLFKLLFYQEYSW